MAISIPETLAGISLNCHPETDGLRTVVFMVFSVSEAFLPDGIGQDRDMAPERSTVLFEISPGQGEPSLRFVALSEGLTVSSVDGRSVGSVTVDLASASIQRRASQGRRGLLARAVLRSAEEEPSVVWDVTAGLGRDAMTLALLGCRVVAFERDPLLGMLLLDGHRRALAASGDIAAAAGRLTIRIEDSRGALLQAIDRNQRPDIVLLDPMFPEGKGRAAVKKEATLIRLLVGEGANIQQDEELFSLAMKVATERVVVKRSLRAPPITESLQAEATFSGKSVRVDRYRVRS
jgi:16S rRNA (guanine1516-N2)-methyltransferase